MARSKIAFARSMVCAAGVCLTVLMAPAMAQAPSEASLERSRVISSEINQMFQSGDAAGARKRSAEMSKKFADEGEPWLAASYAVAAAEYDIRMGDTARIEAETWPRMDELLKVLDTGDTSRGDTLVEVLMDTKGAVGQKDKQKELAELYQSRIRKVSGEGSEADLAARVRSSYSMMQYGSFDEGYARLRETLLDAARSDHSAFTMKTYGELGRMLHHNGMNDQAAMIFDEGAKTKASREEIKETADFYLATARFRIANKEPNPAITTFSHALVLYEKIFGADSAEFISANDYFVAALIGMGQLGTGSFMAKENYDKSVRILKPDDPMALRIADNYAYALRTAGSPARALEVDKAILDTRIAKYGNHFNVLLTANTMGLDYLELGDFGNALAMFKRCVELATATNDANNLPVMRDWVEFAELAGGTRQFDDAAISKFDAITTNADYPFDFSFKATNLLADHFARTGKPAREIEYRTRAYQMSGHENGIGHPITSAAQLALAKLKAKTDPSAAAADFAALDKGMLAWTGPQVSFSASREFGESARAQADDMLYEYAQFAKENPSAVAAFADAVRRWPSLEDGKRDVNRKLALAVGPGESDMQAKLEETIRLSFTVQEIFSAGGPDAKEIGYPLLDRMRVLDQQTNARANELGLDNSINEKPLPTPRELLASDQAQIQYFITRKWKADRDQADPLIDTRLFAIVSRSDREPKLVDLGDPRKIVSSPKVEQVAALRGTRSERGAIALRSLDESFTELHAALLAPLEREIADVSTIFIVPDGQLFAVPFSLLQDGAGRLLEDRYTVRLLTRPESIFGIGADQKLSAGGTAVLAGGIDYANGGEQGAAPLPATQKEVDEVAELLDSDNYKTEVLSGAGVTEAALREKAQTASVLHLATHGSYASARTGGAQGVDTLWQSDIILSRSGDKRSMKRDDTDGRLYAFELMMWDLSKIDLLVLSACETGRGEETFVGGLRGLPTAINIAGAKRSLLTLWPVDDTGTEQFMVRFYKHLVEGKTYPEALRQTRRDAISGDLPAAKDPTVWAAFVMFEN